MVRKETRDCIDTLIHYVPPNSREMMEVRWRELCFVKARKGGKQNKLVYRNKMLVGYASIYIVCYYSYLCVYVYMQRAFVHIQLSVYWVLLPITPPWMCHIRIIHSSDSFFKICTILWPTCNFNFDLCWHKKKWWERNVAFSKTIFTFGHIFDRHIKLPVIQ